MTGGKKLKILHIINSLVSGGAEKLMEQLLPVMNQQAGVTVELLLLTDEENVYLNALEQNQIKVSVLPTRKLFSPFNLFYIRKHIVEGKYDIVHAHLFPTIYWVSMVRKTIFNKKTKFVMTEHSTYNKRRKRKIFRLAEQAIYSNYEKIISISEETQNKLTEWLKINRQRSSKFCVIDNGVDIFRFKNARPYPKSALNKMFSEKMILIGMVARFTESKDHLTVIRALANLPDNIHLVLVGTGPLMNSTLEFAKTMGLGDRVHFLGYRSDVANIMKTIDIAVICSKWEGFGLAAVEAMAAGKPVVATDVPGLSEVVGNAGLLFELEDSETLAKHILDLLRNAECYADLSQRGLIRAEDFGIDKMANRYIVVYELLFKTS